MNKKIFGMICLVLFFTVSVGAEALLDAQAFTDKTTAKLGDIIKYSLVIKKNGNAGETPRIIPPAFEGFRLGGTYSSSSINIINNAMTSSMQYDFNLMAIKSGQVTIAPAQIQVKNPTTNQYETIETKPITLDITGGKAQAQAAVGIPTVAPAVMQTGSLKEIKMNYSFDMSDMWPYILIVLALGGIAIIVIKYMNDKKKPKQVKTTEIKADYIQVALKRIKAATTILDKTGAKAYYSELYETIRQFITDHYNESFSELTSQEILKKVREKKAAKTDLVLLDTFMKACDLVKFAEYKPEKGELEEIKEHAEQIVKEF